MDITQITKCEFETAYNKHAPSKLEKFYFKYFSTDTPSKNKWIARIFVAIMFIPFLLGFIGTILGASNKFVGIFTCMFCILLVAFAIPWIYVWFTHKLRIKRIQKELGINRYEYEFLVDKYYNDINLVSYIKNKVC